MALENAVVAVVCAAVIVPIAITNTQPLSDATPSQTTVGVALDVLSQLGAENQHLARIGARARIVPLESSRSDSGARAQRRDRGQGAGGSRVLWPPRFTVDRAREGDTTIVVAGQHGLTGVSFQVHGPAPTCLPVTGVLPYAQ